MQTKTKVQFASKIFFLVCYMVHSLHWSCIVLIILQYQKNWLWWNEWVDGGLYSISSVEIWPSLRWSANNLEMWLQISHKLWRYLSCCIISIENFFLSSMFILFFKLTEKFCVLTVTILFRLLNYIFAKKKGFFFCKIIDARQLCNLFFPSILHFQPSSPQLDFSILRSCSDWGICELVCEVRFRIHLYLITLS